MQARGSAVIGEPAFNFMVGGSAGKAECSITFQEGSDPDIKMDNTIKDYKITYKTEIVGKTLIISIEINLQV